MEKVKSKLRQNTTGEESRFALPATWIYYEAIVTRDTKTD